MNIFKGFHGLSIHSAPRSVSNGGIARHVMHETIDKPIIDNGGF